MKKLRPIFALLILLCTALVGVAWIGFLPRGTPLDYFSPQARFIRHWQSDLSRCSGPSAAQSMLYRNKEGGEAVRMLDGSWVAVVMEHSCCTGAGFDATLYVASTGGTFLDLDSSYCGWMPLGDEIHNYPKTGISEFLTAVKAGGKKIIQL